MPLSHFQELLQLRLQEIMVFELGNQGCSGVTTGMRLVNLPLLTSVKPPTFFIVTRFGKRCFFVPRGKQVALTKISEILIVHSTHENLLLRPRKSTKMKKMAGVTQAK